MLALVVPEMVWAAVLVMKSVDELPVSADTVRFLLVFGASPALAYVVHLAGYLEEIAYLAVLAGFLFRRRSNVHMKRCSSSDLAKPVTGISKRFRSA